MEVGYLGCRMYAVSFFSVICTICCLCMMSIVYFGLCFMLCYILCEVCFIIFGILHVFFVLCVSYM